MKADNLRKRQRLYNEAIKKAEEREKKGFFEGAALAYLEAAQLLPVDKYSEQISGCFHNAGISYMGAKKYIQAEACLQKSLTISKEKLGNEHPDIASTLDILASVYLTKEEYNKSERYFQQALFIRLKTLTKGHPDITKSLNNLGSFYAQKKEFNEAKEYYQLAKDSIEKSPLEIKNNLAQIIIENQDNVDQEIARLERENLELRAKLHQADRLAYLGRMATMMAHNIKNPVNNITTATVSMLMGIKNKGITAEQLIPSLERILNNSDRLNKIIENFRNFAQGDRTTFSNINLNETIEDIFQLLFVGQYQNHQIELIKALAEFPVMAKTNSFAMQEILITLLNNAKEVLINKESKQVKVITWKNNNNVGFDIEDNGGGIAEEKRDKLFSPFFSSKNDGMGLGLYFCKEILKDLDGNIEYYPAPHGAGFRVTLPIATELKNGT
jgi:signal transduction histidine kinase